MPNVDIDRKGNGALPPQCMAAAEPAGNGTGPRTAAQGHQAVLSLLESVDYSLRQEIIAYANRYDVQTGLLNFHAFQAELDSLLRSLPPDQEVATVWIDLLNVRREFALWGMDAAELLVRNVAEGLRSSADKSALLGRLGARCFVLAVPAAKADPIARHGFQNVLNTLQQVGAGGLDASPEVAAGVAFF